MNGDDAMEPGICLDAQGIPVLLDVVVPGDHLRELDYHLGQTAPPEDADAERYLERRIREAITASLPDAMNAAVHRMLSRSDRDRGGDDRA